MQETLASDDLMELDKDAQILLSIIEQIPQRDSIKGIIKQCVEAEERGYLYPSEDEEVLFQYSSYLKNRAFLLEIMWRCHELMDCKKRSKREQCQAFATGFLAALVLKRVGNFLISIAESSDQVRKKLDQAEMITGVARKSFANLYASITAPSHLVIFHEAVRFYEAEKAYLESHLNEHVTFKKLMDMIAAEYDVLGYTKRHAIYSRIRYRLFSMKRRGYSSYVKTMFQLFKISGNQIAELKQPHIAKAGKDVTPEIVQQCREQLQAGDIIVIRHHDALSNLFLPGYWPHGAFYVGSAETRAELGCENVQDGFELVEAKKDGVKTRMLDETLYVDEFVVLRPSLDKEVIRDSINRGLAQVGKGYDFIFDFSDSERLVCTEVMYRAFQPSKIVDFKLAEKAGRMCLSAEELITQCLASKKFKVELLYQSDKRVLLKGDEAREIWQKNFDF